MKRIIALLMLVPGFAWGLTAIQDLNELTAPAAGDILYIEDVSDTTEDATGTGKHIQLTNLFQDVGMLNFDAAETVTVSTGAATVTQTNVVLAAEGAGTTDTVDSITRSGIAAGDVVILRADSGDTITLANGTTGGDNLDLGSDVVLDSTNETITLLYNGTNWVIASTSPNLLTVEIPASITVAASDETTALTATTGKVTFRMPYAMTLTEVRASVTTAPTGSTLIVDINEGGTTIFDTGTTGVRLTMDAGQKSTGSAAQSGITITTLAVMTDTALADNAEITIDVDQIGSTVAGAGLKVTLIGTRN